MLKRWWRQVWNWLEYDRWTACEHPAWRFKIHPSLTGEPTMADVSWTCTVCGAVAVHRKP